MSALADLKRMGKIRYVGVSNFTQEQIEEAEKYLTVDVQQPPFSMVERQYEQLMRWGASRGIDSMTYGSMGAGILSGKYRDTPDFEPGDLRLTFYDYFREPKFSKIQELLKQMDLPELSEVDALNTLLGSEFDGRDLSIGQWQKLAIARGMFKESSMIVLDEPTAALDPIMETTILKMFLQIAKEKTAIIVSHRIGICREVDKIIVMKKGKVVEIGNHDELLAKKGEYYQLYKMQQKWYVE